MPKPIPDRWIPYKACGEVIEGTRIVCFKVPLKKSVQERVPGIEKVWDIPTLLQELPKLSAVIDLTNTARYYNPSDFQAANVMHRKILMPGREIPPESRVKEFMDAVDEFLGKDCDSLVGVHCTHGLNRTGYMVGRYMRDRLGIPAEEAIKKFEKARGYRIERAIYIAGLLNKKLPPPDRFSDGKETVIKPIDDNVPDGRHWSEDVMFDGNEHSTSYNAGSTYGNRRHTQNNDSYSYGGNNSMFDGNNHSTSYNAGSRYGNRRPAQNNDSYSYGGINRSVRYDAFGQNRDGYNRSNNGSWRSRDGGSSSSGGQNSRRPERSANSYNANSNRNGRQYGNQESWRNEH